MNSPHQPTSSSSDSDNFRVIDLFSPDEFFDCAAPDAGPVARASAPKPDELPASFLFTNPLFEPVAPADQSKRV